MSQQVLVKLELPEDLGRVAPEAAGTTRLIGVIVPQRQHLLPSMTRSLERPAVDEKGVASDETTHLLRSPRNAKRLLAALASARAGEGKLLTVDQLRQELGLEQEEADAPQGLA
jgi:hypothetical protein